MPKCIITKCPHKTGGKPANPGVILHGFPNSIERIKQWLLQTGQLFQHLDEIADIILEGKRSDVYRLCSTHFEEDCYINTGKRKKLKITAVPTIFPEMTKGRPLIEEFNIIESKPRENMVHVDCSLCFLCGMSPNKKQMVNQSTQTESPFFSPAQLAQIFLVTHTTPNVETANSQKTSPNLGEQLPLQCMEGPSNENSVRALIIDPLSAFIKFSVPPPPQQLQQHAQGSILTFTLDGSNLQKNIDQKQNKNVKPLQKHVNVSKISAQQSFSKEEKHNAAPKAFRDPIADMVNESKYIVFEQCLDNLLHKVKCQDPSGCSKVVNKYNKEFHGSAVIIRGTCEDGHYFHIWESQPKTNRFYAGNILFAASLLTTGQNFKKIQAFLKCFGVRHISEKKFHQYQRRFIFPSIYNSWKTCQNQMQKVFQDTPMAISGSGQCSSTGHNTKYCVYTMIDMISDKILDFEVVQGTKQTSSIELKSCGFDICMSRAIKNGQDIAFFASERHISMRKLMRRKYKNIVHQYDVLDYVRRLKRRLIFASRECSGIQIKPWIPKILKHFWWSIQTSKGNAALLKEKWLSLLKHIQNIHTWNDGMLYYKCAHVALSEEANSGTLWLKKGTVAYDKVSEIICNPVVLKDLDYLVWNCHIDGIKVLHNGMKFCAKTVHYSVDAMEARTRLAVIRHNYNIDQMSANVQQSAFVTTPLGTKLATPKKRKKWLMYTNNESVTITHLIPILKDTLRIADGTKTSTWVTKGLLQPSSTVTIEKLDTDIVATRFSRVNYGKKQRLTGPKIIG